ncbi:hypothetical protein [Vulcanisaeta distributa]|uniref:hypothetical protein n=1 Tax=Vulcanisaeta distributa TaxID=164451 RepID=UPI0006CFE566|nr:hypothetical protein [Vulcanisaeta distributa]
MRGLGKVIEDYIKALDFVLQEYEGEKPPQLLRSDEEEFRDAAYEFARGLGIQIRTWMDVVDALLNNLSSGIELHNAKYSNEVIEIQDRVLKLLGVGPNEDFVKSPPKVPNSIARALQEGKVKVYVKPYALGVVQEEGASGWARRARHTKALGTTSLTWTNS